MEECKEWASIRLLLKEEFMIEKVLQITVYGIHVSTGVAKYEGCPRIVSYRITVYNTIYSSSYTQSGLTIPQLTLHLIIYMNIVFNSFCRKIMETKLRQTRGRISITLKMLRAEETTNEKNLNQQREIHQRSNQKTKTIK